MVQLKVSGGGKIVSEALGVKLELSQPIIAPPAPPVILLNVLFLLLQAATVSTALTFLWRLEKVTPVGLLLDMKPKGEDWVPGSLDLDL